MGDDWQAGDLALCIKQGRWRYASGGLSPTSMRAGYIGTVRNVGMAPSGHLTLWFEGIAGERFMDGFGAIRFRRIPPYKADAEDRETIALLTGKPVLEPVS